MEIAPRGLARDSEFFCRIFLFEPFEIDEPYQLDLIGLQRNAMTFFLRTAAGLVTAGFRATSDSAPQSWPSPSGAFRHFSFFIHFCQTLLTKCLAG